MVALRGGAHDPLSNGGTSTQKRQANKLDKLQRIQAAAEDLFVERGYDSAIVKPDAASA